MKIIQPEISVLHPLDAQEGKDMLRFIESMARISHRAENLQTTETWSRFIKAVVLDHGDWSVVEHSLSTVIFRVNRGVTHELVRHRLFSYTQESTRFVNGKKKYPEGLEFVSPAMMAQKESDVFKDSLDAAEESYFNLLDEGFRPQEARAVLPNALAATIAVSGNLRNWRRFFIARCTKETHPDMKQVTIPLLKIFKERVPLLFEDIQEEARQIDNERLAR